MAHGCIAYLINSTRGTLLPGGLPSGKVNQLSASPEAFTAKMLEVFAHPVCGMEAAERFTKVLHKAFHKVLSDIIKDGVISHNEPESGRYISVI